MEINFELRPKYFGDKLGYVAHYHAKTVFDRKAIIERMVNMGTSMTRTDLNAALMLFEQAAYDIIIEGGKVNIDDFIAIYPSISGAFDSLEESFDSSKHTLCVNANISKVFVKKLRANARMSKIKSSDKLPVISEVHDFGSNENNGHLTRGDMVRISGYNLKFDQARADEGIFILLSDRTEIKVNYRDVPANSKLQFILPDFTAPSTAVELEIRTRMMTKTLRKGKMRKALELVS